ncbi:hypothetical protein L2E23_25130, partial [Salmonella enterica subsp. enterica serovar Weltevreden]|uniref:hypothetical protein n=1 Tax=Salmonella enterica TaxID=28901 RepID=UPI001F2B4249
RGTETGGDAGNQIVDHFKPFDRTTRADESQLRKLANGPEACGATGTVAGHVLAFWNDAGATAPMGHLRPTPPIVNTRGEKF